MGTVGIVVSLCLLMYWAYRGVSVLLLAPVLALLAVVMSGDVLMTQGQVTIKGQTLQINLKTGTGRMEGGVTTTFTPGGD